MVRIREILRSRVFGEIWPVVLFSALFLLLVFRVPPNMDEFSSYQPIGCEYYPYAGENVFREGCGRYALGLFGYWLPLRSFAYVGSAQAARYFPVFLLWRDYHSARLMDFLALIVLYVVVRKASGLGKWIAGALVFACFPLVFQTAVDTGPVSFDLAMVLALPFALARTRKVSVAAGIGFLLFVCFWDKPFFLVALPSMFGLGLLFRRTDEGGPIFPKVGRRELATALVAAGVFALFAAVLLSGDTRDGTTFFSALRRSAVQRTVEGQIERLGYWATYAKSFLNFGDKLYDRTTEWNLWTIFYWVITLGSAAAAIAVRGFGRRSARVWVPFVLAAICFLLLNRTEATYAGHHLIFVFPFLILGIANAFRVVGEKWPRALRYAPIPLVVIGLALGAQIVATPAQGHSNWERVELNEFLRRPEIGKTYLIVVVDWGMFYLQSLYGDVDQMVIYLEPFTESWEVDAVREIAARTNRRVLFVVRNPTVSNVALIRRAFPGLRSLPYSASNAGAREWTALAEER